MPVDTPQVEEQKLINQLLSRKLGKLADWRKPNIKKGIGPYDPSSFDNFENRIVAIRNACLHFLESLLKAHGHEGLSALWGRGELVDQALAEIQNDWTDLLRREVDSLSNETPVWFFGGFGHPDYEADCTYWGAMERYTYQEALFLSCGLDPRRMDKSFTMLLDKESIVPKHRVLLFLVERNALFRRKFRYSIEGSGPVLPKFLLDWFREVELEVHPPFIEALQRRVYKKSVDDDSGKPSTMTATERQTALKLIAAMACCGYRYNPNVSRNSATSDIQNDVSEIGASLDQKTILKWLKEASEHVDENYWSGDE